MSVLRRRLMMQAQPALLEPVGRWEIYGLTNEGLAENPVLSDLTGNGHDITLHNFAWNENSGIGGYLLPKFNSWNYNARIFPNVEIDGYRITLIDCNKSTDSGIYIILEKRNNLKFKVSGISEDENIEMGNNSTGWVKLNNGENVISIIADNAALGIRCTSDSFVGKSITIEQLPFYPNALVSDGVDDYGICNNLPIFTKENGYTVVALRKYVKEQAGVFVSKRTSVSFTGEENGAFYIEKINNDPERSRYAMSFGSYSRLSSSFTELIFYQTSKYYNGNAISTGSNVDNKYMALYAGIISSDISVSEFSNIALYALEIYDRDLTESEIARVKERMMDKYNNPEDTTSDWYGVEWYTNQSPSSVRRIGNVNLHKSLPIQSGMYRCLLNDDGEEVYKLDPNDSTKKEDGTAAVLDGTDGQVMVRIPVFYAKFETKGYRRRVKLSDHYKPGFIKMGGCYISAYEATIDRTASGTPKLASVVNDTANFRGGNNNAERDGTPQTQLGMPATATSLTNFRNYARNRKADNTEWNCMEYEAYKALYWLYVVEYANRNCQLDFNENLTSDGFRQGGLGAGVTNINGTKWNTFNGYYPFIPCGYTNSLGNKTGVVAFTMPDEYDAETPLTTYVPSYRGIENPFGHLWKWTDGIHIKIQSEEAGGKSILYTSDNPANYQDTNYEGYEEKGYISRTEGYVKDILFGEEGDMLVKEGGATGASSTTYFSDYFYTNIPASGEALMGVLFGGNASYGANAGFSCASTNGAPSTIRADFGSRLCFIPNK